MPLLRQSIAPVTIKLSGPTVIGSLLPKDENAEGPASEATATARKIARIYYTLVKKGCACSELS